MRGIVGIIRNFHAHCWNLRDFEHSFHHIDQVRSQRFISDQLVVPHPMLQIDQMFRIIRSRRPHLNCRKSWNQNARGKCKDYFGFLVGNDIMRTSSLNGDIVHNATMFRVSTDSTSTVTNGIMQIGWRTTNECDSNEVEKGVDDMP